MKEFSTWSKTRAKKIAIYLTEYRLLDRVKIFYTIEEEFGWIFFLEKAICVNYGINWTLNGPIILLVDVLDYSTIDISNSNNLIEFIKNYSEQKGYRFLIDEKKYELSPLFIEKVYQQKKRSILFFIKSLYYWLYGYYLKIK